MADIRRQSKFPFTVTKDYRYHNGGYHLVDKIPGCRVCILVLKCNTKVETNNIILRPDLQTCALLPLGKHMVHLADPLLHLLNMLPDIEDLPSFTTREHARTEFLKEVRAELIRSKTNIQWSNSKLLDTKPILYRLRRLDPKIDEKFAEYTPWKISLFAGVFSFVVSRLLHMAYVHFVKKWMMLTSRYPFVHRDTFCHITTIPIVATNLENNVYLMCNPDHTFHRSSMILPIEDEAMIQFTIIYLHKFYSFIENRSWLIAKEKQKLENKLLCTLNPTI